MKLVITYTKMGEFLIQKETEHDYKKNEIFRKENNYKKIEKIRKDGIRLLDYLSNGSYMVFTIKD